MKKAFALLLAVIMCVSLFAGCGQSEQAETTTAADSDGTDAAQATEEVKLTFFTQEAFNEAGLEYYESVVNSFHEAHPNITVELLQGGDWKDVDAKLNAAKLSNTYPDVLLTPLGGFSARASMGEFMDLTTYIENWEDKDDIYDASLNIGKLGGSSYGIGVFPVPEVIMYRKDYFAEAGLDPECPPKTWDELYTYAQKLTVRDESGKTVRGGFDVPIADPNLTLMEAFLRQGGNTIIDDENNIVINDEKGVAAMEFLKKFIDEGLTLTYRRGQDDPVQTGKSAMGIVYMDAVKKIIADDPSMAEKIGFFAYTEGQQKAAFNGYRLMMISKDCEHPDEAWEFIKYFYSEDLMWQRYQDLGNIPVRKSLAEKFEADNPVMNRVILDSIAVGYGRPVCGFVNILSKHESLAYEEIMNNVKTAQQALDDAVEAATAEVSALG